MGKFVTRAGIGGSAGETGVINANAESLVCDVEDLTNISIVLVQAVDGGTVVLVTEKTYDGTTWLTVDASTAETDFAAGAGAAVEFTLSDSNGMPLPAKKVRVRASAYGAGGTYSMHVAGFQRDNVR